MTHTRNNFRLCLLFFALLMAAAIFAVAPPCRAQETEAPPAAAAEPEDAGLSDAELGESAEAVRDLRQIPNKTLIFVFDVSGSMTGENLRRAREAAINLIGEAARPGDRVILYTFGAGYEKVFDETLANEAAKSALIDQVPVRPGTGAGTNIRKPHHEALKILEQELPKSGAVVLLTDSFNDEPKKDDPAYPMYLRYYTPGGRLNRYPDTPENRDYERLLAKMSRSRKVKVYGIGVQIDESGRPVERLPKAAPEIVEDTGPAVPRVTSPARAKPVGGEIPWLWIGLGVGALAVAGLLLLPMTRSVAVRITGGPSGKKDFVLKNGQSIRLGGDNATVAFDAYPVPGVKEAPAVIRGSRGQMVLSPATAGGGAPKPGAPGTAAAPTVPATGNPEAGARVFHNGLPLEKDAPLAYGDEVRISVPDPSGVGIARDYRLKFDDPKKSF